MSDYFMGGFFGDLMGKDRIIESSKDGKAVLVKGEIADGINETICFRPSCSKGFAADVKIDGCQIYHIEGD